MNNIQKTILEEADVKVNEKFKIKNKLNNKILKSEYYFDEFGRLFLSVDDFLSYPCTDEILLNIVKGYYEIVK